MTLVIGKETDEEIREYHRKRLEELSRKSVETLRDIPELEEPTNEQKAWFNQRMRGSKKTWETSIDHKPWILRWNYFILEDYQ